MRFLKMISFEDYKACLFGGGSSYRSQLMFRSLRHEVRTLEVNKLALSRDDDKRITVNGIVWLGGITWPRMNLRLMVEEQIEKIRELIAKARII